MSTPQLIAQPSTTSFVTSVASALVTTTLMAANADRIRVKVWNDSNSRLFLKEGATASLTSWTVILHPGDFYAVSREWKGDVDGIWEIVADGFARMTELRP